MVKKKPAKGSGFNFPNLPGFPEIVPPQPGLVPLPGTPFYATPDMPVDPLDCDKWQSSPFCGMPSIPSGFAAIDLKIVKGDCVYGIELTPTFAFIEFPPSQIVWIDPNCQVPPPEPPFEPPDTDYSAPVYIPPNNCAAGGNVPSCVVVFRDSYRVYEEQYFYNRNELATADAETRATLLSFEFPYTGTHRIPKYNPYSNSYYEEIPACKLVFRVTTTITYNEVWYREYILPMSPTPFPGYTQETTRELTIYPEQNYGFTRFQIADFADGSGLWLSDHFTALEILSNYTNFAQTTYLPPDESGNWSLTKEKTHYTVLVNCGSFTSLPSPPPPLPPKKCCMSCCPTQSNNNDALLQLLIQKVDKLSQIVGVDEYPASLPQSLISKNEGFIGNLIPNPNISIPNLTKLLGWYIERFDELFGQWEIPIQIKDSDPTTPGEQPVGIKLPNLAEAIGELISMNYQSYINTETLINIGIRNLVETGTDKQQNFITYKLLQSLTDWVGYKQKDISLEMPLLFTLDKEKLDEILKESKVKVPCVELDEKFGLEVDMMRFREMAAIVKAVNFKNLDAKGDIKEQILNYLISTTTSINRVKTTKNSDDDFDKFTDDAEIGFTNTPGVSDPNNPYGRPYLQRPNIRDLTLPGSES